MACDIIGILLPTQTLGTLQKFNKNLINLGLWRHWNNFDLPTLSEWCKTKCVKSKKKCAFFRHYKKVSEI